MKRNCSRPYILLINPPIYDFAAYDLWAKPLGLLSIASQLIAAGAAVSLLDCCDRHHRALPAPRSNAWGCGKYLAREEKKPEILKGIPRKYKRYGLPEEMVLRELRGMPQPDAVLISSGMTYWYPGVAEMAGVVKEVFPGVPVILGGIYATLCTAHARSLPGIDHVVTGSDTAPLFKLLAGKGIIPGRMPGGFADLPAPAYHLYDRLEYVAIRTTRGCPFRCSYCAIEQLAPGKWEKMPATRVAADLKALRDRGIRHFAFYDDGLLVESEEHLVPLLQRKKELGIDACFHSPNGLHARYLSLPLAGLLKESGFIMPRLSLESTDLCVQKDTGGKVTNEEFLRATALLQEAGYRPGEYAAYLILGLPEQDLSAVEASVRFAHEAGARVLLAEYSPIPGTRDWDKLKGYLPSEDPLWQNNSLFPLYPLEDWRKFARIKDLARGLNHCFT